MILLIAMDTYYNFRFFSMRDEEGKNRVCGRQLVCMFMLHFLANILIWLNTESVTMLAFYGAQVVFFLLYIYLTRLFYRNSSRLLVNNMCTLLATGFIILTRLNPDRAMRQFVIVAAAAVITWIIPFIIDRVWQLVTFPWVYGILGLVLLGVVCVIGNTSYGAQLSLSFGGFTVQPSSACRCERGRETIVDRNRRIEQRRVEDQSRECGRRRVKTMRQNQTVSAFFMLADESCHIKVQK